MSTRVEIAESPAAARARAIRTNRVTRRTVVIEVARPEIVERQR